MHFSCLLNKRDNAIYIYGHVPFTGCPGGTQPCAGIPYNAGTPACMGPWALVSRALVGPLGPCGPGPCGPPWDLVGPPGPLWAGPLWAPWALVGRALGPPWALVGWALVGPLGPHGPGP